jgi:hypothetical protein
MGTRDPWIFLILFVGFSAFLFLVTVLIAQLESYVPSHKQRKLPGESEEDSQHHHHHDEPTAA